MSPTVGTMPGAGPYFPRVSGDEPGWPSLDLAADVFSPRERG